MYVIHALSILYISICACMYMCVFIYIRYASIQERFIHDYFVHEYKYIHLCACICVLPKYVPIQGDEDP